MLGLDIGREMLGQVRFEVLTISNTSESGSS
jgi:hypothetical protein